LFWYGERISNLSVSNQKLQKIEHSTYKLSVLVKQHILGKEIGVDYSKSLSIKKPKCIKKLLEPKSFI